MVKRYFVSFLVCLSMTGFIMCGFGCTGDEPEDVSKERSLPAQEARKAPETKIPPVKEIKEIAKPEESTQVKDIQEASLTEGPPDEIFLKSPLWKTYTKRGVKLTHEKHATSYKIGCDECHHIYSGGKNTWKEGIHVDRCESCHDEPTVKGETKLPPDLKKRNLKLAFHRNCQGCHRKLRKENPSSKAPTTCSKCHKKR